MINDKSIKFPKSPKKLVEHLGRKEGQAHPIIVLPSIQRDAVWKPRQICELWDSLLCGIPIPALTLREANSDNLARAKIVQDRYGQKVTSQVRKGDYFLLDGQQRCMSILSGYAHLTTVRLWLDLGWNMQSLDQRWGFSLCTKARPWGDGENFRKADPAKIRNARKMLYEELGMLRNGPFDFTIPLENTWPVHATVPLPFGELLESMGDDSSINDGNELKKLAFQLIRECKLPKTKIKNILEGMEGLSEERWGMLYLAIERLNNELIRTTATIPSLYCNRNNVSTPALTFWFL